MPQVQDRSLGLYVDQQSSALPLSEAYPLDLFRFPLNLCEMSALLVSVDCKLSLYVLTRQGNT